MKNVEQGEGSSPRGLRVAQVASLAAVVVVAAASILSIAQVKSLAETQGIKLAEETAAHYGALVEDEFEVALTEARVVSAWFASSSDPEGAALTRLQVSELLQDLIKMDPGPAAVFAVFERNGFDGNDAAFAGAAGSDARGRFTPCWTRGSDGRERLSTMTGFQSVYDIVKSSREEAVMDPRMLTVHGVPTMVSTLAVPLLDSVGTFIGIVGVELPLGSMEDIVAAARIGSFRQAYVHVYSADGTVAASADIGYLGKKIEETTDEPKFASAVRQHKAFTMERHSLSLDTTVVSASVPVDVTTSGPAWMVNVNIPRRELLAPSTVLASVLLAITVGVVAVAIAVDNLRIRWSARVLGGIKGPARADRLRVGKWR